jgi:hypothetical protein
MTMALQSPELAPLDLFLQCYVKDMDHWTCMTDMPFSAITSGVLE